MSTSVNQLRRVPNLIASKHKTLHGLSALALGLLLLGSSSCAGGPTGAGSEATPPGMSATTSPTFPTMDSNATLAGRSVVLDLMNPSSVAFSPDGRLTFTDSGNGRVGRLDFDGSVTWMEGMQTEYWKIDPTTGEGSFKLGPLSAIWAGETLLVTDGGAPDGKERVFFFRGFPTNFPAQGPDRQSTTFGLEGNLTGMALHPDGKRVFVCGQGEDSKTLVLVCDLETGELTEFASADAHGIAADSPMQCRVVPGGESLLVLYSGKAGVANGALVEWDIASGQPLNQWDLSGLTDPMGMDLIPGEPTDESYELAVVDNNWDLTSVRQGRIARVSCVKASGEARIRVLADDVPGPVSCVFGPSGLLYVAELGAVFDQDKGRIRVYETMR